MKKFNEEFFKKLGFIKKEENVYDKDINGTILNFRVFETNSYGTNLEFRENGMLKITGYWYDEQDFLTTFQF